MKTEYKNSCFNRIVSRVFVLVGLVSILMGPWNALASSQKDEPISCGEFIAMVANHQPENPLFPMGHSQLSKEELYLKTVQKMSGKGFRVLDKKSFHDPLEANEFVQVSYAFAEGPLGKNLFEQKLFLKKAGIIDSADVGLTTAYDGKVYQTHQEKTVASLVRLATPVYMQDHIKTDLSAKATFTFDDKSTLTLAEDSIVNITKHIYDPEKDLRQTIVHLSKGTVRFVVTKGKARGSMFKVITPTAVAGVRGTEFVVDVDPDGKTTFLVVEGEIETQALLPSADEARIFIVAAGESHSVSKNGKATKVRRAPPGLLKSALVKTSNPSNILKANGISRNAILNRVQRMAMVNKANMGRGIKKAGNNRGMKAKVLQLANNKALKVLDKKIESAENSSQSTSQDSGAADVKDYVIGDVKDNIIEIVKADVLDTVKGNLLDTVKGNTKQVIQEKFNVKGK